MNLSPEDFPRRHPGSPTDGRTGGWSIRRRLLTALVVLLFLGLAGGALVSSLLVRDFLESRADEDLSGAAIAVEGFIAAREPVTVTPQRLGDLPTRYGVLAIALDEAGSPLGLAEGPASSAAPAVVDDLVAAASGLPEGETARITSAGRTYVVARAPSSGLSVQLGEGQTVEVAELVLARDRTEDDVLVRRVVYGGYTFAVLALVVLGSLAWLVLRRGLRPIEEMADLMRDDEPARGSAALEARLTTLGKADSARETRRLAESLAASLAARRQAEDGLRAFVADASHELRTPLTTLSGWLDLYAQGGLDDPDERDRAMVRMEAEVGRMRLILEELDLLALLDRGRPLGREPVDLGALLGGVVEDARVVSPDRELTLECPTGLIVHADRLRLEQVFRNLVGNAAQHTPAGTPIHVSCEERTTPGGGQVVVRVVDQGQGIPDAERTQIFERFHRAGSSRRGGSGLGLAIVKRLVEAHQGQVTLETTPLGATFVVVVPIGGARSNTTLAESEQMVR
jgi:two-component system, OmpR family, sensor kinase